MPLLTTRKAEQELGVPLARSLPSIYQFRVVNCDDQLALNSCYMPCPVRKTELDEQSAIRAKRQNQCPKPAFRPSHSTSMVLQPRRGGGGGGGLGLRRLPRTPARA